MSQQKVRVEKVLVADDNAALATLGTALVDQTNKDINLADGQLGLFDAATDLALDFGANYNDSPVVYIAQGTSTSSDLTQTPNHPLPLRPVERSQDIDGALVSQWTGVSYTAPSCSAWTIGDQDGAAGEINVADETRYSVTIKMDGRRTDILNGRNQPSIFPEFTTPDYSTDGPATEVLQRDDLIQNLAYWINRDSLVWTGERQGGANLMAIAIDSAAGNIASAITLAAIDAAGDVVTLGYDENGGAITHTMSAAEAAAVTAAIAGHTNLALTSDVVPFMIKAYDAGTDAAAAATANTAEVAGTVGNADVLLIIAIDQDTAFFDRIPEVKTNLEVGLAAGFATTVAKARQARALEGQGTGRQVALFYESTDELRKFDNQQAPGGYVYQYTSPVDSTATYDTYTIFHSADNMATNGLPSADLFSTYVFIEPGDTTTTNEFEAALNNWMGSLPRPKTAVNL